MLSTLFHHTCPYLCGQRFLKIVITITNSPVSDSAYKIDFIGFFLQLLRRIELILKRQPKGSL